MVGKRVMHYQITAKIGDGGMGVVWKALDTSLGREVVLKFLPATAQMDQSRRERFLREAKAASALNHQNIVTVYEIGSDNGELFIAMELVRGHSISDLLRECGRFSPAIATNYAAQLFAGLGAAHRAGIVHRDIKPANIMVTDDGLVKILDFGVAKLLAPAAEGAEEPSGEIAASPITMVGTTVGTIPYMSPEQASGDLIGPRSDVFSAGVVLYEMLSGRRPFQGASNAEILRAVLSVEPPPLSALSDIPEPLSQIVQTCLQKDPESRYHDGADAAAHLRVLHGNSAALTDLTTVTMGTVDAAKTAQARIWPRAVVCLGLLAAGLGGGYFWWHGRGVVAVPQIQAETLKRAVDLLERFDRKGNVDGAIALLEPISRQASAGGAVHAALAEAYVRKFNESKDRVWLPRAVDAGRMGVRTNGDLDLPHIALGMALAASGQKSEAEAEFQRARHLNPRSSAAYVGLARLNTGAEAEKLFLRAIELSPKLWIPHNELAAFYYRALRYEDCVAAWREALRLAPDNVAVIRNLGAGLHAMGQYEEAAASLQQALASDETDASTWANLATARYFQGQFQDAARAAEKSVEYKPNYYLYWGNLGDADRWAEGRKAKAGPAYGNAVRLAREQQTLAPEDTISCRIADYLAKSGKTAEAIRELAQKRAAVESDKTCLFKAALVYELAGDRRAALASLGRAIAAGYSMHEIANEPELAALRSDTRYRQLLPPPHSRSAK